MKIAQSINIETMKKIKPQYLINLAWITTGDYYFSDKKFFHNQQ